MTQVSHIYSAAYAPGTLVRHRLYDYVGVIFDVDATYCQPDQRYNIMSQSEQKNERPWYYVIVDGENHSTYVAEENLMACENTHNIEHPMISALFTKINGKLQIRTAPN